MNFCSFKHWLTQANSEKSALVMNAAGNSVTRALAIVALIEDQTLRLNVRLAAGLLKVMEWLAACSQGTVELSTDGTTSHDIRKILTAFAHRPQRSGQAWLADYNHPSHLQHVVGPYGQEQMRLRSELMLQPAREAFEGLIQAHGEEHVQRMINAYFFGDQGSKSGLFGMMAAWRSLEPQQPLTGDILTKLTQAAGNLPQATLHDLQHPAADRGTSALGETMLMHAGAANHYRDAEKVDALAFATEYPLQHYKAFVEVVLSRLNGFINVEHSGQVGMERQAYLSSVVLERWQAHRGKQDPVKYLIDCLTETQRRGGLVHLNRDEKEALKKLLTDRNDSNSLVFAVKKLPRNASTEARIFHLDPALLKADKIQEVAVVRHLPTRAERFDMIARLLALELLLVRNGVDFRRYSMQLYTTASTSWSNVSQAVANLKNLDFADQYPRVYQEVHAAMQEVAKSWAEVNGSGKAE